MIATARPRTLSLDRPLCGPDSGFSLQHLVGVPGERPDFEAVEELEGYIGILPPDLRQVVLDVMTCRDDDPVNSVAAGLGADPLRYRRRFNEAIAMLQQHFNPAPARAARVNKLGYRGVKREQSGAFSASICVGGKRRYLGNFKAAEDAAMAWDAAAIKAGHPQDTLNFPERATVLAPGDPALPAPKSAPSGSSKLAEEIDAIRAVVLLLESLTPEAARRVLGYAASVFPPGIGGAA